VVEPLESGMQQICLINDGTKCASIFLYLIDNGCVQAEVFLMPGTNKTSLATIKQQSLLAIALIGLIAGIISMHVHLLLYPPYLMCNLKQRLILKNCREMRTLIAFMRGMFLFLFILILEKSPAQDLYQKLIRGGDQWATSVCPTFDSGFAVTGLYRDLSPAEINFYKFNKQGQLSLHRYFFSGSPRDVASITQTKDSGYAILSSDIGTNLPMNISVTKVDKNLNLQWTQRFGGSSVEEGVSIINTSDNGVAFVGYTYSLATGVTGMGVMAGKFSASGGLEWLRKCGTSTSNSSGASIIQNADGSFLIAGSDVTTGSIALTALTPTGDVVWAKAFKGAKVTSIKNMIRTKKGDFVCLGLIDVSSTSTVQNDLLVMKLDSSYNLLWAKAVGTSNNDNGTNITEGANGDLLIAGSTSVSGSSDNLFMLLDSLANPVAVNKTGGAKFENVEFSAAVYGGYVAVGRSGGYVSTVTNDTYIAKLDTAGNTCSSVSFSITSAPAGTITSQTLSYISVPVGGLLTPSSFTIKPTLGTQSVIDFCQVLPLKLLSFTVSKARNTVVLDWLTENEININRFEIERSETPNDFKFIGSVYPSRTGSIIEKYSFADNASSLGVNYYRLKIIDNDGKYEYGPVRLIRNNEQLNISIRTNPVSDYVNLSILSDREKNIKLEIFNSNGEIVFSAQLAVAAGKSSKSVPVNYLSKGLYFIIVNSNGPQLQLPINKL
jgi:hypothetical protein